MDIILRSEARQKGLKIYYTGQPCKNGHDSYRYVQSGTCAACIRCSNGIVVDQDSDAKKAAKAQMVRVNVRCYEEDRDHVAVAVWALAVMRWPFLTQGDVDPKVLPKDKTAGTALYSFNCHEADIATVRDIAAQSMAAKTVDVAAVRRSVFGTAADVQVAPVPEWARIPQPGDFDYK